MNIFEVLEWYGCKSVTYTELLPDWIMCVIETVWGEVAGYGKNPRSAWNDAYHKFMQT